MDAVLANRPIALEQVLGRPGGRRHVVRVGGVIQGLQIGLRHGGPLGRALPAQAQGRRPLLVSGEGLRPLQQTKRIVGPQIGRRQQSPFDFFRIAVVLDQCRRDGLVHPGPGQDALPQRRLEELDGVIPLLEAAQHFGRMEDRIGRQRALG